MNRASIDSAQPAKSSNHCRLGSHAVVGKQSPQKKTKKKGGWGKRNERRKKRKPAAAAAAKKKKVKKFYPYEKEV